ncbi:hypothetical protein D3C79_701610 [compost metagenome]
MSGLLQRGAGLVQLAEQHIHPAQVVFLALQLFVGQGSADAACADQQGNEGHGQAQLQAVVGGGQAQGGVGRNDQRHRSHCGEMGGNDAAGHEQARAIFQGLMHSAAAVAEVAGHQ